MTNFIPYKKFRHASVHDFFCIVKTENPPNFYIKTRKHSEIIWVETTTKTKNNHNNNKANKKNCIHRINTKLRLHWYI